MVEFKDPTLAQLAPVAFLATVFLSLLFLRWVKRWVLGFGNPDVLDLFSTRTSRRKSWRVILYFGMAVSLGMLAWAQPQSQASTHIAGRTLNAIVVCDASQSMNAEDYPDGFSRHDVAIRSASNVFSAFPKGYFGVVPFTNVASGYGLINESSTLKDLVQYVCLPDQARGEGSDIVAGLEAALKMIKNSPQPIETVILLSDGGDTMSVGEFRQIVAKFNAAHVRIVTAGLGDKNLVRIPVRDPDTGKLLGYHTYNGIFSTTRLDEVPLRYLAAETGGEYRRLDRGDELVEIIRSHGWNSQPIEEEGKESLVWIPVTLLLLVLCVYLLDKRLTE